MEFMCKNLERFLCSASHIFYESPPEISWGCSSAREKERKRAESLCVPPLTDEKTVHGSWMIRRVEALVYSSLVCIPCDCLLECLLIYEYFPLRYCRNAAIDNQIFLHFIPPRNVPGTWNAGNFLKFIAASTDSLAIYNFESFPGWSANFNVWPTAGFRSHLVP